MKNTTKIPLLLIIISLIAIFACACQKQETLNTAQTVQTVVDTAAFFISTDEQIAKFEVEQSVDGSTWCIKGETSPEFNTSYYKIPIVAEVGKTYLYRIRAFYPNGTTSVSKIVATKH